MTQRELANPTEQGHFLLTDAEYRKMKRIPEQRKSSVRVLNTEWRPTYSRAQWLTALLILLFMVPGDPHRAERLGLGQQRHRLLRNGVNS